MDDLEQRREDCRFAILGALNARQSGAHEAKALRSVYMRQYDFSQAEVDESLELLATAELVRKIPNPEPSFGVSWQITMKGSRAYATR